MADNQRRNVAYAPNNPLQLIPPQTVIATRDPLGTDYYPLGTWWVNKSSNASFILTSISGGVANWQTANGTSGIFSDITVDPGNIEVVTGDIVADAGNIEATLGTITAGGGFIASGGNVEVDTGDVDVLLGDITADAGNIVATLGSVTAGTTVTAGTSMSATTTITAGTGITATTGNVTATTGSFVVSGAGTAVGFAFGAGPKIVHGTGSPDTVVTAPQGSLFLRTDGASADEVLYVNTDSATAWTPLVS